MKRPHWKNDLYRDKKYLLDRNETCDPEFNAHLRSFINALPLETITHYPSMSKAYNALIKLSSMPGKNLFLTSGSEQGIKMILENNMSIKKLVFPEPTFKMVEVYANLLYFDYEKVPYRYGFNKFDIDLNFNKEAIIYLASPDNPTGAVYPRDIHEEIAAIARDNRLFVIADEIYSNIVYDGRGRLLLSEWIGDVPALAMRGISKEYPWPGGRCGWLEVLNKGRDPTFASYIESLVAAKRLEVSSTTLPQMSIPLVMGDSRYEDHLGSREQMFSSRADEVEAAFEGCEHVIMNKPSGAFYFTVMFKDGLLNGNQSLEITNPEVRAAVERMVEGVEPDKRFVYYLMGATGIVVVPLTGFQYWRHGFRATLLEMDDAKRGGILASLRQAIEEYIEGGP